MKKKYLLSTGRLTDKLENYILDLFKLHLSVYPGDIPGANQIGFNFIITNTKKDELKSEVIGRIEGLVNSIKNKFTGVDIKISDSALIGDNKLKLIISVNEIFDTILVDL
jgi:hypothetical protein